MNGSPFPGMDPYLEGEMWQEFHETLAGEIRAHLLSVLPPRYVALLAKRYVADRSGLAIFGFGPPKVIYPDVHVATTRSVNETAVAEYTAVAAPAAELLSPMPVQIPVLGVEIRDVA